MRSFATSLSVLAGVLAALIALGCATSAAQSDATPARPDPNALTVIAEIALERGDCRTASEKYAEAAMTGDAALARRASEVALACEHLPAAREAVKRWRTLSPEDRDAAALQATVALKLYQVPEGRAAITTFINTTRRQAKEPKEADAKLAELAGILSDEADATAVLAAMSEALEDTSPSPMGYVLLAQLAMDAFDSRRAEQFARQALRTEPKMLEARRVLARAQAIRGDAQQAIDTARETMRLHPDDARFELADILATLDHYAEARQELERVDAGEDANAEVERRLALLAFEAGDMDEAQQRFTELAVSGRAADSAIYYLADIAARDGDIDVALAGFKRLADSSLAMAARARAAQLLMKQNNRAEALAMLDDYASEHPERAFDLTVAKAHLLADHDEVEAGLELLATALERHPKHPALEYDRAVLLERAGQVRQSVDVFGRLLKERPEDPTIMNALGYTLADHGLELSRAESLIRRALEKTPDNPAVIDSLGWVRFKRGDARGAVEILERAYRIGGDPEIAAHWGEALWKSGNESEARRVWAEALARTPDAPAIKETLDRLLPPGKP